MGPSEKKSRTNESPFVHKIVAKAMSTYFSHTHSRFVFLDFFQLAAKHQQNPCLVCVSKDPAFIQGPIWPRGRRPS